VLAGAAVAAPQQVLYVGDSLGVGTTPGLARELGSSARVHGDSRIGRPSPEGLRVLQQTFSSSDQIVVFDVGTNDDPAQPGVLARDLAAARKATGNRCLVVATLNRPPLNGASVDGLNQAVLAFSSSADNVQLVDWNAIAQSEPSLLGPDKVHPTPQGYALRAQLFAEAVGACSAPPPDQSDSLATPAPAPKKKRPPRKRERRIKVPGIESSGISFSEPVRVRGRDAQLLLPNTLAPYPAVVMIGGAQKAAEYLAAHGIAALTYADRGSVADARAAVALLSKRDEIRRDGIGVWARGHSAQAAARVARDSRVAAVAVDSPDVLPAGTERDWRARQVADAPAVSTWLRTRSRGDDLPASSWQAVRRPVLAIWRTRDRQMPIRASADALKQALVAAGNHDRTFRWFEGRGGYAPGQLEETARWLGLHLGAKRALPVIHDELPPANPGPEMADVANASALYAPPVQFVWLLAPALMLGLAASRMRRASAVAGSTPSPASAASPASAPSSASAPSPASARLALAALAAGIACAACIAAGVAMALNAGEAVEQLGGTPWPFALAFACAAALAVIAGIAARRRAWLVVAGAGLWLALALFWLV
jgi:lysophospholipase L1-like esterase